MSERPAVDLRSDTVTQPTDRMREAMAHAAVGDDVFREDPTVNELQRRCAELTGHEAGLFMPTGSMGNEVALGVHTQPGNEVVLEEAAHINNFELGAMAAYMSVLPRPVPSETGRLSPDHIASHIKPASPLLSSTDLIALENTHNMKGGAVLEPDDADAIVDRAHKRGIPVHLDGARAWNAAAALGVPLERLTRGVDSAMLSFSKGLGAPVGSVLVGSEAFIDQARVVRKRMGGGMRQAGILAAACRHALEHHREALRDDHAHAERLAEAFEPFETAHVTPPETNILIVELTGEPSAAAFCEQLRAHDVWALPVGARHVRMVTHRDVPTDKIDHAVGAIQTILGES